MSIHGQTTKPEQPRPKLRSTETLAHPYSGRPCKVIDSFIPRSEHSSSLLTEEFDIAPVPNLLCPVCSEAKIKAIKLVESDPPSKYPLLVVFCEKGENPHWLIASGETHAGSGSDV